jgi:hypothetical protein
LLLLLMSAPQVLPVVFAAEEAAHSWGDRLMLLLLEPLRVLLPVVLLQTH